AGDDESFCPLHGHHALSVAANCLIDEPACGAPVEKRCCETAPSLRQRTYGDCSPRQTAPAMMLAALLQSVFTSVAIATAAAAAPTPMTARAMPYSARS